MQQVGRLRCLCGHIIYDDVVPAEPLSYKAYFFPEEDEYPAMGSLASEVTALFEARDRGEQEQYVQELELLPEKSSLTDVFIHVFWYEALYRGYARLMYECEECGRLWMRTSPHRVEFVSYVPESPERGILTHDGTSVEDISLDE